MANFATLEQLHLFLFEFPASLRVCKKILLVEENVNRSTKMHSSSSLKSNFCCSIFCSSNLLSSIFCPRTSSLQSSYHQTSPLQLFLLTYYLFPKPPAVETWSSRYNSNFFHIYLIRLAWWSFKACFMVNGFNPYKETMFLVTRWITLKIWKLSYRWGISSQIINFLS